MQTLMRPLGYSTKETLNIIKEKCTLNLLISLRAYKISDLDTLMILADEFEELEEREEKKLSRTKSAAPALAIFRRCEDTCDHEPRRNDQWTLPQQDHRRQATNTPYGAQRAPQQNQQRQPTSTLRRPPSTTQRLRTLGACMSSRRQGE